MTYNEVHKLATESMYDGSESITRFTRDSWKKEDGSYDQIMVIAPPEKQKEFSNKDGLIEVPALTQEDRDATDWILVY